MENLTKYALDGLRLKNEELFIKRAYEVIDHFGALPFMVNGIPTSIKVVDELKLINGIQSYYKNRLEINIDKVNISNNFEIEITYSYAYIRYYNNKKDAENKSWNNFKELKDKEYNIAVETRESSCYYINIDKAEMYGLKLELL